MYSVDESQLLMMFLSCHSLRDSSRRHSGKNISHSCHLSSGKCFLLLTAKLCQKIFVLCVDCRLYPVLPGNGRITQDDLIVGGYFIPKGVRLGYACLCVCYGCHFFFFFFFNYWPQNYSLCFCTALILPALI